MYDVIVVGTRVAGATTAMLLAARACACSPSSYCTPGNLLRILGPRGLAKVMLGRMRG
jgi:flavin-dependent dehydrogenase